MQNFLETGRFCKIICAAGNEDLEQIEKIIYTYSKAGCRFFDVAASKNVILTAQKALKMAQKDAFVCISVGTKNDVHIQKAFINKFCNACGECSKICPQKAINEFIVQKQKCIGCKRCLEVCDFNAINFDSGQKDFVEFLPELIDLGVHCIEFHISEFDESVLEQWKWLCTNYEGILSVSIKKQSFSDERFIEILKQLMALRAPYTTIIQSDGISMSGDIAASDECIKAGLLVQKQGYEAYLVLSGGTNLNTLEIAKERQLNFDGIAFGSFARKAIESYISADDFWENPKIRQKAIEEAQNIVNKISLYQNKKVL